MKALFNLLFRLYNFIWPYKVRAIEELTSHPKTFLVISSTALGDTILSTPAFKSLKQSFPTSRVVALISYKISPLLKDYPYIDSIVEYRGGYKSFFATIGKIRAYKPEVALILHGNGPQDIQIAVLSQCQFILKHPTQSRQKRFLSYDFPKKNQHNIEDRLDLIRKIGGGSLSTTLNLPDMNDAILLEKFSLYHDAIGLQIGAANVYKMWPIDRFIELAQRILDRYPNQKIVITGIKSEQALGGKIVAACGGRVVNLCGSFTIEELPYFIQSLKLLTTNDTGTLHLAIALGVPTLSLFSGTNRQGFGPYQDLMIHKVIQKSGEHIEQGLSKKKKTDWPMRLIAVDEVFQQFQESFNES